MTLLPRGERAGGRHRSWRWWLAATALALLFVAGVAFAWVGRPRTDYGFFAFAFAAVLHGHGVPSLYHQEAQYEWMRLHGLPTAAQFQYVYPPQFAVLLSWLGWLPLRLARNVWSTGAVVGYAVGVFLVARTAFGPRLRLGTWLFLFMAAAFTPFLWDEWIGNANWLVFLLLAAAAWLWVVRNHPAAAGVLIGLAVVWKVTPLFLLLYLLARKQWRLCTAAALTMAASTLLTAIVAGTGVLVHYVVIFPHLSAGSLAYAGAPYNFSLFGVLRWLFTRPLVRIAAPAWLPTAAFIAWMAVGAVYVLATWRQRYGRRIEFSYGVLAILFFSPLVEVPHLIILLIPLATVIAWLTVQVPHATLGPGEIDAGATDAVAIDAVAQASRRVASRYWPLSRWLSTAVWLIIWIGVSPGGWWLLGRFPAEYFVVFCLLILLSVSAARQRLTDGEDAGRTLV